MVSIKARIGVREIEKLEPHSIIWDTDLRGFNARRQFSSAITFSVFYRNTDGTQRFLNIGRYGVFSPHEARQEARRVLMAASLGKDPSAEKQALRDAPTMAQVCDWYVSDMEAGRSKKASTIRSDKNRINVHIKPNSEAKR